MDPTREWKLVESVVRRSPAIICRWRTVEGWPLDYVSESISRFGYTAQEFLNGDISWAGIMHPDDVARCGKEIEANLQAGHREWSQSYRIFTKDGQVRWVDDWNLLTEDEQGELTHIEGIVLDVTDRVQIEESRHELQQQVEDSLTKALSGYVGICAQCKRIRDEQQEWVPVEQYVEGHSTIEFTHGYCPECLDRLRAEVDEMQKDQASWPTNAT